MIGGKSLPERSFVHPKKHVFGSNFLKNPAPYLFSGLNWLYGAFRGKIVPDENFAQFCLRSPLKFVFPKNTFSVGIFCRKRPHTSFLGLIGYMVHSGEKLFLTKTFFIFASKALSNSFFQKTCIRFEFLY